MASVFVLDDDEDWTRVVRRVLGRDGHDVSTFSTFAALQAQLLEALPDVIVLDYTLSDTTGDLAARTLRDSFEQACPHLVLISGRGMSIAPTARALFDRVLRKPIPIDTLRQAIRDALR